ncbi:MAG: DUF3102 domain-containing protein [Cyanobacteria bacterium P01_F01_bin.143]
MSSINPAVKAATKFNYESLDSHKRTEIEEATLAIREKLRKAAQDIWEIGHMLSNVQAQLQRGQFDDWVKTEFDWSRRTAYKFISVYKRFDSRVNLEEVNIATSALYLLAAESTPQEIREEFIQQAQEGKKVTHQEVLEVVRESRKKTNSLGNLTESLPIDNAQNNLTIQPEQKETLNQNIISIIPQIPTEKPLSDLPIFSAPNFQDNLIAKNNWYELDDQHKIYCGDTALPEFTNYIPYAALAIAITTDDWEHDWLIDKARTIVVFPESEFEMQKLTGLLVMFSAPKDTIIFPWLPKAELVAIAHQLGRKVFAGDLNPERCQAAIDYVKSQKIL